MGREIRRVPKDWVHPKQNPTDYYQPLHDQSYKDAANEWLSGCIAWSNNTHPDLVTDPSLKEDFPFWWEYDDSPPDKCYYRPEWASEPTAYQVYETVTEGTPISPVLETIEQVKEWLVQEGYSEDTASRFIEDGYLPSLSGSRVFEED